MQLEIEMTVLLSLIAIFRHFDNSYLLCHCVKAEIDGEVLGKGIGLTLDEAKMQVSCTFSLLFLMLVSFYFG